MNSFTSAQGPWRSPGYPKIAAILGCHPDHGDHQLAWKILGLHSKTDQMVAIRPDFLNFRAHCETLFGRIWTEYGQAVEPGSLPHRRIIEANRRLLSAVHTLAGVRLPGSKRFAPNQKVTLDPVVQRQAGAPLTCKDFPTDLDEMTWTSKVYAPAPKALLDAHLATIDVAQMARHETRSRRVWQPTLNMMIAANEREANDLRYDLACYGFRARPKYRFPGDKTDVQNSVLDRTFYAAPVPQNENSLWYSLSLSVESHLIQAKSIKSAAASWMREILTGPRQPQSYSYSRFTYYCQLIADSRACLDPDDVDDWGTMDILRCLHRNDYDSGMPMEAGYHEMLYFLSDFFQCEIITFTPRNDTPDLDDYDTIEGFANSRDALYNMRVYGLKSEWDGFKLEFQDRRQILLVTDSSLRHFRPVVRIEPELPYHDPILQRGRFIDTSAFELWDRLPPLPWWPGYRRNVNDDGWTGDWIVQANRQYIRNHPADLLMMQPTSLRLAPQTSPYWITAGMNVPGWESYHADADMEMKGVQLPDAATRLTWIRPWTGANHPPIVRTADNTCAGYGDARFKSKGHFNGSKRVAEIYEDDIQLDYSDENGYLRVRAEDKEDRTPSWHKRRRR